jgi:heat shock protein HtpX
MPTLYEQISSNTRKTYLLISLFLVLIIGLGWVLSYLFDAPYLLIGAVVFSVLMSFFSYWYSDKIVLKISRAKPLKKEDHPEIYRLVENLTIAAGMPMPRIYIIEEDQPNAFATGRDEKHAVIALTSGLIKRLEKAELEGVIAHELSHIKNRDILLSSIVVVLVGIIILISDWVIRLTFWGGLRSRDNDRSPVGTLLILLGFLFIIIAPILARLIQFAVSRKREFLADASGVLLTRYPEGLIQALRKISNYPYSAKIANNATAHLFIASPFRGEKTRNWLVKLFSTHPPVEERIKALEKLASQTS